jgi:Putative Flp pilus-assembly TadE/G-like
MMGRRRRHDHQGQILAVFALSLTVMVAIAGLSIDAGGAYAQRRDQQSAADLAALAAANDYLINGDVDLAEARARIVTADNGFTHGSGTTAVGVGIDLTNGVVAAIDISSPHANTFLGVLGMSSWTVSTHAEAIAGFPDTAEAVAPFIFSIGAFEDDGTPKYQTDTNFGETNGDVPETSKDIAWTNFGTGNVDTGEVSDMISGDTTLDKTLEYGEYIGQQNSGFHNWLFDDVDTYLSGYDMPVAVVDYAGNFMGWAMFHVTSATGAGFKHIRGYFLAAFTTARLKITACAANDCPRYLGSYVLKLWD